MAKNKITKEYTVIMVREILIDYKSLATFSKNTSYVLIVCEH